MYSASHSRLLAVLVSLVLLQAGCTGGAVEKPPDGETSDAEPIDAGPADGEPVTADDGGTASDDGGDGDPADPTQTRTYTRDQTTDFLNPERGWYVENDFSSQDQRLSMRYVRLDDYRDRAIPQAFLDSLAAEMAGWRDTGSKAVLRFAYNRSRDSDAPLEIVLQHIGQIAPLLEEYRDVIAVLQAGFIGAWGEWHSSTNDLIIDVSARHQIMDALLAAAPPAMMVQFRTPWTMEVRFPTAITEAERFNGSVQAHMGFHNDCFLTGETDSGTYSSWDGSKDIQGQRRYGQAVGRVAAMGGETCDLGGLESYNDCGPAIAEMEDFGWDYLNIQYWTPMIDKWRTQGCYDEISRRLGYRYVLDRVTAPTQVEAGGPATLALDVTNAGFGKLYNQRPLQIVFTGPGGPFVVTALEDCRRAMPLGGESKTVPLEFTAPPGLVSGQPYELHLRLPDASSHLQQDVRHMIRFANAGTWDSANGLNSLDISVTAK